MKKMPTVFIGHGSPMNAIEDNEFTDQWVRIAGKIPKPEAILSVSAHWYTQGSKLNDEASPKMIYDMYGFPEELYEVVYKAKGAPLFAHDTRKLLSRGVEIDNSWGLDHGTWSVLRRMYPAADIPVFQLSIDGDAGPEVHFMIGKEISALREQGVLILGSGNIVHNLSKINWGMAGGYPWAEDFDHYIKNAVMNRDYQQVIHYENAGESSKIAFFTPEHFYPLLYVLGAAKTDDRLTLFNEACLMGSMSMTCYLFE